MLRGRPTTSAPTPRSSTVANSVSASWPKRRRRIVPIGEASVRALSDSARPMVLSPTSSPRSLVPAGRRSGKSSILQMVIGWC